MTGASDERGVVTLKFDATRASLGATGALNSATAGVLAVAVNEHIDAQRRFVRLDVSGVTSVDDAAVTVLAGIHSRLLAERGTLILTGVDSWLEAALVGGDHAFLVIAPTAADET